MSNDGGQDQGSRVKVVRRGPDSEYISKVKLARALVDQAHAVTGGTLQDF